MVTDPHSDDLTLFPLQVHNTIATWSYEQPNLAGLNQLNSYRIGVANGLLDTARGEKKAEEKRAIEQERKLLAERVKKEEEDRERELQRLRGPMIKDEPADDPPARPMKLQDDFKAKYGPNRAGVKLEEVADEDEVQHVNPTDAMEEDAVDHNPAFDSDSDADDVDVNAIVAPDFASDDLSDAEHPKPAIPRPVKWEPVPEHIVVKEEETSASDQWQSMGQLTRFRKDAETIADDYLKATKVKLTTGRKRTANKIDSCAYKQGKEDSKKIDVKRRRLEGGAKREDSEDD